MFARKRAAPGCPDAFEHLSGGQRPQVGERHRTNALGKGQPLALRLGVRVDGQRRSRR